MLHEHVTSSTVWEVKHNLNTLSPAVTCWIETDELLIKILPLAIEAKDENTTEITFTRPYTGRVEIRREKRWSDD